MVGRGTSELRTVKALISYRSLSRSRFTDWHSAQGPTQHDTTVSVSHDYLQRRTHGVTAGQDSARSISATQRSPWRGTRLSPRPPSARHPISDVNATPMTKSQPRPIGASVTHLQMWIASSHTHTLPNLRGGSARAAAAGTRGRARGEVPSCVLSPPSPLACSLWRTAAAPDPRGSESLDIAGGHSNVPLSAKVGPT